MRIWHNTPSYLGGGAPCGASSRHRHLAPHNLRRTCARLCHLAGGELEQIQFLLGHVSIQMTERIWAANKSFVAQSTTKSGLSHSVLGCSSRDSAGSAAVIEAATIWAHCVDGG